MENAKYHIEHEEWLKTSDGKNRGHIDMDRLRELWIHCGTGCNLSCPDCFEHASPGDNRLEAVSLADVQPFIDEAVKLGVEKFSFTGGEPFLVSDTIAILRYALQKRPCLVLSNGTKPLRECWEGIMALREEKCPLSFRISIDCPDRAKHEMRRGKGTYALALKTVRKLHESGFEVSVARRQIRGEDSEDIARSYREVFRENGLPADTPVVAFPSLHDVDGPEITEHCIATYHTPETCRKFMCAFSRMLVKQNGEMRVYACTLVDDHVHYDLGSSLEVAVKTRVLLEHPRCFTCFAGGVSCSEL